MYPWIGKLATTKSGGEGKGPATLPNCISLLRFAETTAGC